MELDLLRGWISIVNIVRYDIVEFEGSLILKFVSSAFTIYGHELFTEKDKLSDDCEKMERSF